MVNSIGNINIGYNEPLYNPAKTPEKEPTEAEARALKRAGVIQCETCANRQYQDGSNESDVSFKSPGHISPQASAGTVMAHEQQHVANAHQKASSGNGEVVQASVTLKMSTCPECGRSYVSGGQTNTAIKYNTTNPYGKEQKIRDEASGLVGMNVDYSL